MDENERPPELPDCDPNDRFFPIEWKESYFRRFYEESAGGYVCPDCGKVFSGVGGFKQLRCDHVVAYANGGRTVWSNMTLLCSPCNIAKSAK